jgi:PAS domain S-box-containing protein
MKLAGLFRDAPIGRKLMLIGLLTTALALFSVSLILVARGWVDWRDKTVAEMENYAALIGANAAPSMIFADYDAADEVLRTVGENSDIVDAVLYDRDGKVFARYRAPEHSDAAFPFVKPGSYLFSFDQLVVSKPVMLKGETWGTVYLESDLRGLYAAIGRQALLTFVAASGVFMVALFLFSRLQRAIVVPVTNLSAVMRRVSAQQDYAVRVPVFGKDEVGVLAGAFNDMLAQIQVRDEALERHRTHLEEEVAQRTAELRENNRLLEHELVERKRAEEIMERLRRELAMILESAGEGICTMDTDGNHVMVNPSAARMFGYEAEEMVGRDSHGLWHYAKADGSPYPEKECPINATMRDGVVRRNESEVFWRKGGASFPVEYVSTPIRSNGAITGTVVVFRDITERKQMEEKVRKLNEELELKVQQRTRQLLDAQEELVRKEKLAVLGQVAGSVGHELRNPLGVMNNAVYFLQTVLADADDSVKEYLEIIKGEIAVSDRIVGDLLDSVRTKPPQPEVVGVAALVEQTLRKLSIPASIALELDIPGTLPPLRVDALQIHQVLRNLISNGVEAMPDGGTLEIRAAENPDGTVTVGVRDTGIGMTPEQLGHLFQPLFTTKARGIGLGLVVVRNLTQANGGTVNVESEAGKGTVFAVTLPVADETGVPI